MPWLIIMPMSHRDMQLLSYDTAIYRHSYLQGYSIEHSG